ncbi:LmbU family transcriptional regulator [Actinoplanes sp. NEAU-A12]|uniref:LmbU family transcriptional regulator n=1 Tax=Actinoplanes sandaracinus TaxID=3045177 RepID=A0ABT6WZQ1_9ACTN|nr:LmbU family transcriptional regulator [Actinoplanes sandaracinus]MDI6105154.1 LmbU family transcriptional regulator [Actinoplanes sandaracinus]
MDNRAVTKRTALSIPQGMPIGAWRNLGRQIFVISDASAWWLGDWLIYGQAAYPNRYKHAIAETALDYQTLRNYAWIARRFAAHRRREKLSFQHHAEVASLPEDEQDALLTQADLHNWSRNELRRRIQQRRRGVNVSAEVIHLQMDLVPSQKDRWQEAAKHVDKDLLDWIRSILDHAAATILETDEAPRQMTA